MRMTETDKIRLLLQKSVPTALSSSWGEAAAGAALAFHRALPAYAETALVPLSALARSLDLGGIYVKDESTRFGLNAFKGLGGSFAIHTILEKTGPKGGCPQTAISPALPEFVTATDGNHGKGVAWAAALFGSKAHVYMPRGSAEARRQAILDAGAAEAVITDLNYDGAVALADRQAKEHGWILVQDTSWDGYEEIPARIVQGYLTLAAEAAAVLDAQGTPPTHVFLQAGVGAMAGGVAAYLRQHYGPSLKVVTVEPEEAACLFTSWQAGDGLPHTVGGHPQTIMAGLNCGTPCGVTWPVLRDQCFGMAAVSDDLTRAGMRRYAHPLGDDRPVVSGESGAVTLGFLMAAASDPVLRRALGLDASSRILLISTEGDTDPEMYRRIVDGPSAP
ncbi:MAG: diaminopropionate ammonia-lyase [Lachnospiraceae bacterium]|nr:diaminopropionate ammonia-lyase [Lachnospiraceae bacterium]